MKYTNTYLFILAFVVMALFGCKKFLDRPPLTEVTDETAWTSEDNLRLYANKFYPAFFTGYGLGFNTEGAAMMDYQFSDDVFLMGNQGNFTRSVPNGGSIWEMDTIRSVNIMLDRMETRMKDLLEEDAYNHWTGIARFFRGLEYTRLVTKFGDVPYYDYVPSDINLDDLYKPRTPRNEVMDAVYNDLKFALENVRASDGDQFVNKYVVAGFTSRAALYEGTWQKYYYNNNERARKFLELAQEAANIVISSGKYDIVTDFRSLFASNNLGGNKDVVFYRNYDAAAGITHSVASYNNLSESLAFGPTTDLIKSFICVDGNTWQTSGEDDANDFTLSKIITTRDSRLEASFYDKPTPKNRAAFWYITKFIPRSVITSVAAGATPPNEFTSSKNETDYPVFRYAEALLNWIEAKAELSTIGGAAITQADINLSVNKIRDRPLAKEAEDKGVKPTAHLDINNLPNDPEKDPSVPALLWEIRRERRMELAFEHSRFEDLKRWGKVAYMDTDNSKDLTSGGWVNFSSELPPTELKAGISVIDMAGNTIVYNGSNGALLKGFLEQPIQMADYHT
ncbi:RagB/SusD family nutrient uptake outer membrane protein [Niabella ginsengisoli]|uniref:RagB/SusD family nutrient uptake outer membrane protein n=1 Tax=Niabella ginsengisoli TaxID=522298 RepID=A0ABS9SEN5_9BACT|nr:RagB/SusD family nutrient uptake outer membrane protein [Niabella ginsengisoli]MCH5596823.1 RagB/SusD family nutrient uptake outer membrane protein [Niabella ginsengisoli]